MQNICSYDFYFTHDLIWKSNQCQNEMFYTKLTVVNTEPSSQYIHETAWNMPYIDW